jgi:hypothetical protein
MRAMGIRIADLGIATPTGSVFHALRIIVHA